MKLYQVMLSSMDDIKSFVNAASAVNVRIDLFDGYRRLDGKSLLELFSLELDQPIDVWVYGNDEECRCFAEAVSESLTISGPS